MFTEPEGFFEPEKQPTTAIHQLKDGRSLEVRLVGHNPLWGHFLWNAGRTIAHFLEEHAETMIQDQTVLELGAGAGLPSLISAVKGAKDVVVTDYPDAELIDNLTFNIDHCSLLEKSASIVAKGYLWGAAVDQINVPGSFDVLILADLLFNHSEHVKLVASIEMTLKRSDKAQALVFFTPYRPWLFDKDMAFFELAEAAGFTVEKIIEHVMDKVMFDDDPGDELLRRTVFGYRLRWRQELLQS
ncbi:hypothetical protein AMS68_001970 [Peltaster fructicola]|uniref:Protein N-terminal and lysine N-methyltransferase EFM7 n=1 Tax=Peltaster fructicola TaxID=286661 RepID=A0A6H0XP10_9PEZI|nr:hypothetical protein AMS68_001970 [Peltaster fructicola]